MPKPRASARGQRAKTLSAGLRKSGRGFTYDGKPIFINAVNCETLAMDTRFDFTRMLDFLTRYRFNKLRIWGHSWHGIWTGGSEDLTLRPWKYIPGPNGWEDSKWDLDQWNPAYWERVKAFCCAARDRGIIVEFTIFSEWVRTFQHDFIIRGISSHNWWNSDQFRPAWNKRYNINHAFSTNGNGDLWPEFFNLDHGEKSKTGKTLYDYQKAYVDKVLLELGAFPNVYYEVHNEYHAEVESIAGWQNHWARYIKSKTNQLVGVAAHQTGQYNVDPCNSHGSQHFRDQPFIDVLNFHWYCDRPEKNARVALDLYPSGKILTNNEGVWQGVTGTALSLPDTLAKETRSIWGAFMVGSHYGLTDFPSDVGTVRWNKTAQRYRALRNVAETLRFWELSPVDSRNREYTNLVRTGPCRQWRVLANPGKEYLVYFWDGNEVADARMDLPRGKYEFKWYDVQDGEVLSAGAVAGGKKCRMQSPNWKWNVRSGIALTVRKDP
jgi:hypothetical protein